MTTEELLDLIADRLGLTSAQRDALLGELSDAVTAGLQCDGRVGLGDLGHLRLELLRPRRWSDGQPLPERAGIWFRPSADLMRATEDLPLDFAQQVAADTTPRSVWDAMAPERREREREREGVTG